MNINNRINEIETQFKAMSKPAYHKSEVLQGMLDLQQEMVKYTFNNDYADNMNLKIYDIIDHLEKKNEEANHIADKPLEDYRNESKKFGNLISREITGAKGEQYVQRSLEVLNINSKELFNVELMKGDVRTELDAIVITSKAVFLLEVKNPRNDMVIDAKGNYYRAHGYMSFGRNLGEKVNDKRFLLNEALKGFNKQVKIVDLVVFSNNQMKVENRNKYIKHCYLSQLTHLIEGYQGPDIYSEEDYIRIEKLIIEAESKQEYSIDFDFTAYKHAFAVLIATLEEAMEIKSIGSEKTTMIRRDFALGSIIDSIKEEPLKYLGGIIGLIAGGALIRAIIADSKGT